MFDRLGITKDQVRTIDKIDKMGKGEVEKIVGKDILDKLSVEPKTARLSQIFTELENYGLKENIDFVFNCVKSCND